MKTQPDRTPLAPHEVLRVMDAAQIIHERQAALKEHEAFDREATIRDIQLMYEELGDLVDADTIEKALDEYLSQRYAFTPAPKGLRRNLALLYIKRGWVATRVILPTAAAATIVWGGFAYVEGVNQRMQELEAAALVTLEVDVERLHEAVLASAAEDLVRERAAALDLQAESQLAAQDADALERTAERFQNLHDLVAAEYRIEITGGVWRYRNNNRNARNHYLVVRALDADGRAVTVPIRNEETGATARVREWGERVPQEVYDRVAADKQDNGIIDDEEFGFKRRGFITAERRYPDVGQITEW